MAASSASMAALKLLNLRHTAPQSHTLRQLLRPAASSSIPTLPDVRSVNLFHFEKGSDVDSTDRYSSNSVDSYLQSPNLSLNLQWPLGFSAMRIEAARTYVPKEDEYQDIEEDDEEDDGDEFDDEDDVDIQDYSGSDIDDKDESC